MSKTISYRFPDGQVVTWSGANRCLCSACRNLFNSVAAFDKHLPDCAEGKGAGEMPQNEQGYYVTKTWEKEIYGE